MTLTDEQRAQFRALTDPLIQWLNANCHPHCTVIVTNTDAELLEGQCVHHTEQHLRDKPKSVGPAVAAAQELLAFAEAFRLDLRDRGLSESDLDESQMELLTMADAAIAKAKGSWAASQDEQQEKRP